MVCGALRWGNFRKISDSKNSIKRKKNLRPFLTIVITLNNYRHNQRKMGTEIRGVLMNEDLIEVKEKHLNWTRSDCHILRSVLCFSEICTYLTLGKRKKKKELEKIKTKRLKKKKRKENKNWGWLQRTHAYSSIIHICNIFT